MPFIKAARLFSLYLAVYFWLMEGANEMQFSYCFAARFPPSLLHSIANPLFVHIFHRINTSIWLWREKSSTRGNNLQQSSHTVRERAIFTSNEIQQECSHGRALVPLGRDDTMGEERRRMACLREEEKWWQSAHRINCESLWHRGRRASFPPWRCWSQREEEGRVFGD